MKPIPNNKMCQNNNTISNTVTSNFTPKNLNGYDLLDKNCFHKISDQQLLDLANNIISPDASLDKFQLKYKNNRYKEDMIRVCEDDMKRDFKLKRTIENNRKSKESDYVITESASQITKLPKNVLKAMDYYNKLNN